MITVNHLCKSYRIAKRNPGFTAACKALFHREYEIIHALKDVSFTISDGEMVGYIGPNGAGKSSTITLFPPPSIKKAWKNSQRFCIWKNCCAPQ